MSRSRGSVKTWLVFFHRWLGVVFCLPFLLWFASGVVLMYRAFPSVSEADRLNHRTPLNASAIHLTPQQAYDRLPRAWPPESVRIVMVAGRPAYRFKVGRGESIVYADDGTVQDESQVDFARRVAAAWTGQPPFIADVEELTGRDQWTVSGEFRPLEPMRKFSWPDGEQVYVSTVVGDVVQYTTRASRMGAYFGAIPHWLYFTPLRKHARFWSRLVVGVSGMAVVAALLGILIGISVYSWGKVCGPGRVASAIPYIGLKRLHMILGLGFGVIATTWAFSGMLSMDPFPRLQGSLDQSGAQIEQGLRGATVPLRGFEEKPPQDALRQLEPSLKVKELELTSFAGEPIYLAKVSQNNVRIIPIHGQVAGEFEFLRIVNAVQRISQPAPVKEARVVPRYEAYYLDRHNRLPLPAIFVRLGDRNDSSFYIDPKTAQVVESYGSRSRWNRWLYHGLHSMDFPWLYAHRPAWDIVVLTLMTGGLGLGLTALLLAIRALRRAFALET